MFLTQKVCSLSKVVIGIRVRFKEARIHNRFAFSQRDKKLQFAILQSVGKVWERRSAQQKIAATL